MDQVILKCDHYCTIQRKAIAQYFPAVLQKVVRWMESLTGTIQLKAALSNTLKIPAGEVRQPIDFF